MSSKFRPDDFQGDQAVELGGGTGCDQPWGVETPFGSPGSASPRKVAFSSRRASPRKVASAKGKGVLHALHTDEEGLFVM